MDLLLLTLLRREDVAGLRFADVHDGLCGWCRRRQREARLCD